MTPYLACFFFLTTLLMSSFPASGQSQQQNLEKYWNYRQRLRDKFVFISSNVEAYGVNIPASARNHTTKVVEWGDGNMNISHYLAVLATELYLLKENDQDYQQTLKELYFAMLALERLDAWSEAHWRYGENPATWFRHDNDINGMHLRDDVTDGFWNVAKSYLDVPADWTHGSSYSNHEMEEISQDNIYHHMEALALISNLLRTETVNVNWANFSLDSPVARYLYSKGIQSGSTVNFSLWAKDLVKRYIHWMQIARWVHYFYAPITGVSVTNHWVLVNPVTATFVQEGSGSDYDLGVFYNAGVVAAGQAITGENLREYDPFFMSVQEAEDLFVDLFNAGPDPRVIDIEIFGITIASLTLPFDDYKVRTLGTYSNIIGENTFGRLRTNRDRPSPYNYEHMPLLYCALFDDMNKHLKPESPIYDNDRTIIEGLLDEAPAEGPIGGSGWTGRTPVTNWSHDSRLVWPEKLGTVTDKKEFSGLDYMLLHNLYYLSFRREDFRHIVLPNSPDINFTDETYYFKTLATSDPITGTGTTNYVAGKSITMQPGFIAPQGTTFTASIGGYRPNQYRGALYLPPSDDGGRIPTVHALPEYTSLAPSSTDPINVVFYDTTFVNPEGNEMQSMTATSTTVTASGQEEVIMFPNPARSDVSFQFTAPAGVTSVELINPRGETVCYIQGNEKEYRFDLSSLPGGLYTVRMQIGTRTLTRRLMIKK